MILYAQLVLLYDVLFFRRLVLVGKKTLYIKEALVEHKQVYNLTYPAYRLKLLLGDQPLKVLLPISNKRVLQEVFSGKQFLKEVVEDDKK